MITAFGQTRSLTAWARATGLRAKTLAHRIDHGEMTPEQALGLGQRRRGRPFFSGNPTAQLTIDGVTQSLSAWAAASGHTTITVRLIWDRLHTLRWNARDAVTLPPTRPTDKYHMRVPKDSQWRDTHVNSAHREDWDGDMTWMTGEASMPKTYRNPWWREDALFEED